MHTYVTDLQNNNHCSSNKCEPQEGAAHLDGVLGARPDCAGADRGAQQQCCKAARGWSGKTAAQSRQDVGGAIHSFTKLHKILCRRCDVPFCCNGNPSLCSCLTHPNMLIWPFHVVDITFPAVKTSDVTVRLHGADEDELEDFRSIFDTLLWAANDIQ